jgi:hypothetical protein
MGKKPTRGKPGGEEVSGPGGPEDPPERWSAQRKMELVLRLLRGEPLDAVSRESQVPAHELDRGRPPPGRRASSPAGQLVSVVSGGPCRRSGFTV